MPGRMLVVPLLEDVLGALMHLASGMLGQWIAETLPKRPNMKAGQKLGIKRAARVHEEEALALLIQSGRYVGYLADHVARTFSSDDRVWPIAPADTGYTSTFAAITRNKPEPNRKTMEFIACLKAVHSKQCVVE